MNSRSNEEEKITSSTIHKQLRAASALLEEGIDRHPANIIANEMHHDQLRGNGPIQIMEFSIFEYMKFIIKPEQVQEVDIVAQMLANMQNYLLQRKLTLTLLNVRPILLAAFYHAIRKNSGNAYAELLLEERRWLIENHVTSLIDFKNSYALLSNDPHYPQNQAGETIRIHDAFIKDMANNNDTSLLNTRSQEWKLKIEQMITKLDTEIDHFFQATKTIIQQVKNIQISESTGEKIKSFLEKMYYADSLSEIKLTLLTMQVYLDKIMQLIKEKKIHHVQADTVYPFITTTTILAYKYLHDHIPSLKEFVRLTKIKADLIINEQTKILTLLDFRLNIADNPKMMEKYLALEKGVENAKCIHAIPQKPLPLKTPKKTSQSSAPSIFDRIRSRAPFVPKRTQAPSMWDRAPSILDHAPSIFDRRSTPTFFSPSAPASNQTRSRSILDYAPSIFDHRARRRA